MASKKLKMKAGNRWADELYEDIVEMIIKKLNLTDWLRFSAVCVLWKKVMMERHPPPVRGLPWLMLSSHQDSETWDLLNLSGENRVYQIKVPEARGGWCCGSSDGWLIMANKSKGNFLLNPFSRAIIQLPHQITIPHPNVFKDLLNPRFINKTILSSAPTASDTNCVVVAIDFSGALSYCRLGDESWKSLENDYEDSIYEDVIFYKAQLHAITCKKELMVVDFIGLNPKVTRMGKLPRIGYESRDTTIDPRLLDRTIYLVESEGKLLMVFRFMEWSSGDSIKRTRGFLVFEFVPTVPHWAMVKSLGDRILFLGKSCSMSFTATSDYCFGVGGNRIYFTDDDIAFTSPNGYTDSGVYWLEDQSIEVGYFPSKFRSLVSPPVWIAPCLW